MIHPDNHFPQHTYVENNRRKIYRVKNVPGTCWDPASRHPAYLLVLVGHPDECGIFVEKHQAHKDFKQFVQKKEEFTEATPEIFKKGDTVLHIASGGTYPITHLPSENVLENSRRPAYGYTLPDGRTCWRAQHEMEDGRFTRVDPSLARLMAALP